MARDPSVGDDAPARPAGARQLVLDLGHDASHDPDDFLVSPSNAEAHAMLQRWPDWPDRTLLLVGPSGCGKSHLGAIWAEQAGARIVLPGAPLDPDLWSGATLIEDADRAVPRDAAREAELFHALNLVREQGGWLLVTAREPAQAWGLRTPDLVSRLRLAPLVPIGRPDAPLIHAVIVKLFTDRQIRIDEDVVAYAARHCERSLEAVSRFVAAVDEASLAAGRRITRPLAVQAIASLGDGPSTGSQAVDSRA